ncbi:MAG: replicative DNA helicase, partial [Spirochaetia bacterium]|nr:replicative DNA helicase [Spirochaetia bacterium]
MDFKDKIPPHNLEAEKATLGAILLNWNAFGDVITLLKPEDFYSQSNQIIYKALRSLSVHSITGDLITLIDELTKNGELEKAGGAAYISSLTDVVPTSANLMNYAQMVHDFSIKRTLIKIGSEIKAECFDDTKQCGQIVEDASNKIFAVTDANQKTEIRDMQSVIYSTIELIEKQRKNQNALSGIPSGFTQLDSMTNGFQKGEMTIIGARPSMGKTALALSMMQHIAIEKNIPCGFFSLEMSAELIGQRIISQVARIPSQKLRSGMLRMDHVKKLQDAA